MANANKASTITLSLRDAFTGPLRAISASTSAFTRQLQTANTSITTTAASMENAAMRLTAALSIPAGLGIAKSVSEFGKFEDATIDAKRAIDGFTDETAAKFKSLAQEMGASYADTFAAAAEAGKAGLTDTGDIEQFLRLQRKVAVAFELPAKEAAQQLMALKNGYRLTLPQLEAFGDQINKIADSSSSNVPDLIDFSSRVAPAAALLGINRELVASFGAVGLSANISSERMATAFNKMTQAMVIGSEASATQNEGFAALGLDAENIAKLASNDATAAAEKIMNALAGITDSADQQRIALQIFGKESADEILSVVGNLEELNRLRSTAATSAAGSVDAEYARRQEAMTNSIDRMRASFSNLGTTIGERFAPRIKAVTALVEKFNNFLIANPAAIDKIVQSLLAMAASGPGLFLMAKALRLVGLAMAGLSILTSPLARLGQLAGLAAVGFGRSGRAAFAARRSFMLLGASTLKTAAGFGLVGLAGYALYKSLPGIGKAFEALKSDIDLSAAMSSASAAFDALMGGRPEMAAHHARMAFDSILKAGKRLGANLKTALGEGWALAVAQLDEKFPSFKGFRESVTDLGESISGLLKSITSIDTGDAGSKIQGFGKQLAEAGLKVVATILRALASALDSLSAAIERFNKAAPEGGLFGGLKAAFDGLPLPGKMLAFGLGFRLFATSLGLIGAAGAAIRGFSMVGLVSGLTKLGALKLGAIGWGLAEIGKAYGLLPDGTSSEAVGLAFMALPAAIEAAAMAASGAKTVARWTIAGARAAAAYIAAFNISGAIGAAISAAWAAISTAAAAAAGALAGRAYALGMALSGLVASAAAGAFAAAGAAGSAATIAAGAAGTALGGVLAAAIALAIPAAIAAAVLVGLKLVDPKGNLGGLTKPIDDAMRNFLGLPEGDGGITPGEIGRGLWSKITGNPIAIDQPTLPANDNKITTPQISTPQINVTSAPAAAIGTAATPAGGFAAMPTGGGGTDLAGLKDSIGSLRTDTATELGSLRAATESQTAILNQLASTSSSQTGILSSIDRGISAIPGAVRAGVPWQGSGSKPAASSAPPPNLPSTGYGAGPS